MSMQIITGFTVNSAVAIDNRIVASGAAARNAIPYKYVGMRVFDTSDNRGYYWDGSSFNPERTDQVNGTTNYVPKFTSQYFIGDSFIYSTSDKVGIGTTDPKEYLQIGSYPVAFSGQGMPFTIHKGGSTVLASNWYYDGTDQWYDSSKGSTRLIFEQTGALSFKSRGESLAWNTETQSIYISKFGKFGVGPNWSNSSSPQYTLDVQGVINGAAGVGAMRVNGAIVSPSSHTFSIVGPRFVIAPGSATDLIQYSPNSTKRLIWSLYDTGYLDVNAQNWPAGTDSGTTFDLKGFSNINLITTLKVQGKPWLTSGDQSKIELGDNTHFISSLLNQGIRIRSAQDIDLGYNFLNQSVLVVKNSTAQTLFRNGTLANPSISFIGASSSGIFRVPSFGGCPDPETLILLRDNILIEARNLKVGDIVHTLHEKTLEWGNFEVTYVEELDTDKKLKFNFSDGKEVKVSSGHRFLTSDGNWINSHLLKVGDTIKSLSGTSKITEITDLGPGKVIKITINNAGTYIAGGLISHNAKGGSAYEGSAFSFSHEGTEYMRLTTDGNLGVGTWPAPSTTIDRPQYKIAAQGFIQSKADKLLTGANLVSGMRFGLGTYMPISGRDRHLVFGFDGAGAVLESLYYDISASSPSSNGLGIARDDFELQPASLNINPSGGNVYSNGFSVTSDIRLKRDVNYNFSYGINEINNLKPVTFKLRKLKNDRVRYGFIAQDIKEILPDLVENMTEEADGHLAINQSYIIPILVKAVQELSDKVKKLEGN